MRADVMKINNNNVPDELTCPPQSYFITNPIQTIVTLIHPSATPDNPPILISVKRFSIGFVLSLRGCVQNLIPV
jgi:hypothetical protein